MKPTRVCLTRLLTGIAANTFVACSVFAQSTQPLPQITVSGSAEIKVAPDEIQFNVGVETRSPKLEDAKHENDERVSKVLQFLKTAGIPEKRVQTDFVSIEPTFDNRVSRVSPVIYVVRKGIGVRLDDVTKFEAVLTGLLTNGATHINGIEFRTAELRKHRDAARAMAIRAAREKADALAKEMGIKRGRVHNISANEFGGSWSWSGGSWWGSYRGSAMQNVSQNAGGAETGEGTVSLGQINVTATVNVSFLIE